VIKSELHRIARAIGLIQLKPFDCTTEQGRSQERYRRISLTVLASTLAKAVSVLTVLISVPLTLGFLGSERFGLWMTISSLVAMLSFADLGLGNGLLNAVASAHGRDNEHEAAQAVSSTFAMLTGISLMLGIIFFATYKIIPWIQIYNVSSSQAMVEAGPATAIFIACFLLNIPSGLTQRIQLGYQEGFYGALWSALGSVLGLLLVLLTIHWQAGLPWLVLSMSGSTTLAQIINSVFLFGKRPYLIPKWKRVDYAIGLKILKIGLLYFVLQIAVAVAYTSDNIIVAQILGPEAVTQYAVPFKMFSVVSVFAGMVLYPLWPAYGEAITRGDHMWVRGVLVKSLQIGILAITPVVIVLVFFGTYIIHCWAGSNINPSSLLLIGLAIWTVLGACGDAMAMLLYGAGKIRFQVITALLVAGGSLALKIILAGHIGVSGIILGTIMAYTFLEFIPYIFVVNKMVKNLNIIKP
jgi:O-antigen/teichoic acid export membrane protein